MDEGIGFRYAPKRYALRAPLGLRSSRRPHPFREERKQQTETAFRKTQLQNLTHTTIEPLTLFHNFELLGQIWNPDASTTLSSTNLSRGRGSGTACPEADKQELRLGAS